jgi:transcriptional repressor NrdR
MRTGLAKAVEKRPVSVEDLEAAINKILSNIRALGEREVAASVIGEEVMKALRSLDDVAYVRFASVYRRFQDVQAFREEIDKLQSDK